VGNMELIPDSALENYVAACTPGIRQMQIYRKGQKSQPFPV